MLDYKKQVSELIIIHNNNISINQLDGNIKLGRNTSTNHVNISLNAVYVSRNHGEFSLDEKGYYYIDTDSKSGTYYNNILLKPFEKKYLKNGDILQIRNNPVHLDSDIIYIIFNENSNFKFKINQIMLDSNINEVIIDKYNYIHINKKSIPNKQVSFFKAEKGWAIINHDSTVPVYVNNSKILQPKYLNIGNCIYILDIYYIYYNNKFISFSINKPMIEKNCTVPKIDSQPNTKQIINFNSKVLEIDIKERIVNQKLKKHILLKDIYIKIHSGEMVLILGGSGAGKTTFMNAVMGYEKANGNIIYNNMDIYENFKSMKFEIGFVPQQDLMCMNDSTYHTLKKSAEIRMPNTSNTEREKRIIEVLEIFGLSREKNTIVSKLSGGQRKRLSIAMEYINNPSLFFLDEPDSGLDGIMARSLMEKLRDIANEDKIVMVISHAPDRTAELFDKIIVLAKSEKDNIGHLAFFGTVPEAFSFFETNSLEGVVKRINRKDENGDGLSDTYIEKYKYYKKG